MTADDLRQEIEQTRQRLGETVDELASKADMKARARAKAAEMQAQARDRVAGIPARLSHNQAVRRHWPIALTAAGLLMAGSAVIWRWRQA
jgi:hypothetical protein